MTSDFVSGYQTESQLDQIEWRVRYLNLLSAVEGERELGGQCASPVSFGIPRSTVEELLQLMDVVVEELRYRRKPLVTRLIARMVRRLGLERFEWIRVHVPEFQGPQLSREDWQSVRDLVSAAAFSSSFYRSSHLDTSAQTNALLHAATQGARESRRLFP